MKPAEKVPDKTSREAAAARHGRELAGLYAVVLIMIVVPSLLSPEFRSAQNLTNILNQMAPVGMVALGQTFAILSTGIDLSVGAIVSLVTALSATYMGFSGPTVILGMMLSLAGGLLVGLLNGTIVTKLKVDPLIATLGTMGIVTGTTLFIMPYPGGYVPRPFTQFISYQIGGVVPMAFVYFSLAAFGCWYVLNHTRFGRRVYAVGGDEEKARIAGIHISRVKLGIYLMSAFMATLGGFLLAARMRSGDPLAGDPYTLNSIAAVLVGGTTFSGGRGGILHTFAGLAILSLLSVILNLFGVSPFYQNILSGVIVIIAVVYSTVRQKS